jgi:hypothetical protein
MNHEFNAIIIFIMEEYGACPAVVGHAFCRFYKLSRAEGVFSQAIWGAKDVTACPLC